VSEVLFYEEYIFGLVVKCCCFPVSEGV